MTLYTVCVPYPPANFLKIFTLDRGVTGGDRTPENYIFSPSYIKRVDLLIGVSCVVPAQTLSYWVLFGMGVSFKYLSMPSFVTLNSRDYLGVSGLQSTVHVVGIGALH